MNRVIFDIETETQPLENLLARMPVFEAGANLKDPVKIAADIERKKKDWIEEAALSPLTGQVLVIGIIENNEIMNWFADDEAKAIEYFWGVADHMLCAGGEVVGFNSDLFDLPFLARRSYALGVKIPKSVGALNYRRWQWHESIIDLRTLWQLGDRQFGGGLDAISKFLGGEGKTGSGKDFAMHWHTDRPAAIKYLENDLNQTKILADKML